MRKSDNGLKRENIKGRYYWVVREKGRFKARTKYNRTKKRSAMVDLYKRNKSLDENIVKSIHNLENVKEITIERLDNKIRTKDLKRVSQIVASVNLDGVIYTARSHKFGGDLTKNKQDTIDDALNVLYRHITYILNGESDSNEGKRLLKDKDVRLRVVTYRKK